MKHKLTDLIGEADFKILAKRYLNIAREKDAPSELTLAIVQQQMARAIGHSDLHAAQNYWKKKDIVEGGILSAQPPREYPKTSSLVAHGFSEDQADILVRQSVKSLGCVLVCGTAGSGSLTTIGSLTALAAATKNPDKVWTLGGEDFCRRAPPMTKTTLLDRLGDEIFKTVLTVLRGGPELIAFEEVFSAQSAKSLRHVVQGGVAAIAKIHASGALGIVERLNDFEVGPNVTGSPDFLNALVHQKLLSVLCPQCSLTPSEAKDEEVEFCFNHVKRILGGKVDAVRFKNPEGCEQCGHTGREKREVVAEVIEFDYSLCALARKSDHLGLKNKVARQSDGNIFSGVQRGKSTFEHALFKVSQGRVSPVEVGELLGFEGRGLPR